MPIYEYQCQSCDTLFEEWQSGFEEREMDCPECGTSAKRLISHTSFQLKGSGWYVTDYAGKKPCGGDSGSSDSNCEGGGESANESASADTGGVESTPAAKKETSDTPSAGSAS